jgi:putative oxidoreductase
MTTYETVHPTPSTLWTLPLAQRVAGGGMIWFLGRLIIGGLFLMTGSEKLMGLDQFATVLIKGGIPDTVAPTLALLGAAIETVGGAAIVLGLAITPVSLLMMTFVVIATFIGHRFWEFEGQIRQLQLFNFEKNVMLLGTFCLLYVAGGGPYSIDRWWRTRRG